MRPRYSPFAPAGASFCPNGNHGLQPWLCSDAAPRLLSSHPDFLDIRSSELAVYLRQQSRNFMMRALFELERVSVRSDAEIASVPRQCDRQAGRSRPGGKNLLEIVRGFHVFRSGECSPSIQAQSLANTCHWCAALERRRAEAPVAKTAIRV